MIMQIWLIRHASTSALEEGRLQGQADFPLSFRGRVEAGKLAERLKEVRVSEICCSPLLRARETAEIAAKGRDIKVKLLPFLREYSWGIFDGLTWAEAARMYPRLYKRLQADYWHTCIPGREKRRKFLSRIVRAKKHILSNYNPDQIVMMVTHGRFINAFITCLTGKDLKKRWMFTPDPASVSVLEGMPSAENYYLKVFNDCGHLS